jgi:hypothetical protein
VPDSSSTDQLPRHLRGVALPPTATADALRARYGTDRRRRGPLIVAVLVLVPFVTWVLWAAFAQADRDLRWETVGFGDVTAESITVRFTVYLPPEASAVCTVRAMNAKGVEVGRAQVPVESAGRATSVVYALPVTERPSTAFVETCQLEETPA